MVHLLGEGFSSLGRLGSCCLPEVSYRQLLFYSCCFPYGLHNLIYQWCGHWTWLSRWCGKHKHKHRTLLPRKQYPGSLLLIIVVKISKYLHNSGEKKRDWLVICAQSCIWISKHETMNVKVRRHFADMFVLMLLGLRQSPYCKVGNGSSPLPIPYQSIKDQEVPASNESFLVLFSLSKVSRASRYSSLSLYFTMLCVLILPSVKKELYVLGYLINIHCTLCLIWILYWQVFFN